jgi:hypothetical protein
MEYGQYVADLYQFVQYRKVLVYSSMQYSHSKGDFEFRIHLLLLSHIIYLSSNQFKNRSNDDSTSIHGQFFELLFGFVTLSFCTKIRLPMISLLFFDYSPSL